MLLEGGGRETERAGRHRLVEQRGDFRRLLRRRRPVHRFLAHHVMAKRRQRREEAEVDGGAAPLGRVEEFREGLPVPGHALAQRVVGNRLDIGQIPGGDFARFRFARRHADAAVAHHDRGDAVPRSAADKRIPADLRIVMGMRIDEARADDQVGSIDHPRRALLDLTNLGNPIADHRDIGTKARRAGAVDHRAVFD